MNGLPDLGTQRHCAIFTAKNLALCCEPQRWPRKPPQLAMVGGTSLLDMVNAVTRGYVDTGERQACQQWLLDRASVRQENKNRLGALLWCLSTLKVLATRAEHQDKEAGSFFDLAASYLTEVWGVPVPEALDVAARNRLAWDVVDRMHREALR